MPKVTKKRTVLDNKIKVFVSTKETQGMRENDFCYVPESELVRVGSICDDDINNPDSDCGCSRMLVGLHCNKGTTTVKVALVNMTKEQYINEYIKYHAFSSFGESVVKEEVVELLEIADSYDADDILEFRSGSFNVRPTCP
jgi:hypothetical protein